MFELSESIAQEGPIFQAIQACDIERVRELIASAQDKKTLLLSHGASQGCTIDVAGENRIEDYQARMEHALVRCYYRSKSLINEKDNLDNPLRSLSHNPLLLKSLCCGYQEKDRISI